VKREERDRALFLTTSKPRFRAREEKKEEGEEVYELIKTSS
jgi:hypothetical protein